MTRYEVELDRAFLDDLRRYEQALTVHVTAERLAAISSSIIQTCEKLETAPVRGTDWSDVRPGLRTLPALGPGTLLYVVDDQVRLVSILGWAWRGAPVDVVVQRYRS